MEYSQKGMIFIEDPDFEKRRRGLLNDDELFELMKWLAINPGAGKVIPGSGGLAKCAGVRKVVANGEERASFTSGGLLMTGFYFWTFMPRVIRKICLLIRLEN